MIIVLCVHVSQDKRQNFSIGNISGTNGVLCLTFDDRHFDSWTNAIPMFRKYNAKVTFYPHGNLSKEDLQRLCILHSPENGGHSIGCHTVSHSRLPSLLDKALDFYVWYKELRPQIKQLASCNIKGENFAYPFNDRTKESDCFLLGYFDRLRVGIHSSYITNHISIVSLDDVFYPKSEVGNIRVVNSIGIGEWYQTDVQDICKGIKRISERDEVLVLFSHGIYDDADSINMKTTWLETILECARTNKVECLGFDDLPVTY